MKYVLAFCFFVKAVTANAQSVQNNFSGDGRANTILKFNGDVINTIKPDNVTGTPLLSETWDTGYVKLNGNRIAHNVLLQFNLEGNILYFMRDNNRYKFIDRVIEFAFTQKTNEEHHQYLFRSNYPLNGNYNDLIFYQVAAENDQVQFLKYCTKKIRENYVHNAPSEKQYYYREEWFLYLPKTKTFYPISNKKSVVAALPQYKEQIESLCEKNKWSLKEASQITALIKSLN